MPFNKSFSLLFDPCRVMLTATAKFTFVPTDVLNYLLVVQSESKQLEKANFHLSDSLEQSTDRIKNLESSLSTWEPDWSKCISNTVEINISHEKETRYLLEAYDELEGKHEEAMEEHDGLRLELESAWEVGNSTQSRLDYLSHNHTKLQFKLDEQQQLIGQAKQIVDQNDHELQMQQNALSAELKAAWNHGNTTSATLNKKISELTKMVEDHKAEVVKAATSIMN